MILANESQSSEQERCTRNDRQKNASYTDQQQKIAGSFPQALPRQQRFSPTIHAPRSSPVRAVVC
jgi:hypothetical protein